MELRALRISRVNDEALAIRSYELIDPQGAPLPPFTAGAHIDLHLHDDCIRSYSLCNDPRERHRYLIAVLREAEGRGGSLFVHEKLTHGSSVLVSEPQNCFPLAGRASHHTLIAGGIGITPILSMVRFLEAIGANYSLHYCASDPQRAAFCSVLADPPFHKHTSMHFSHGDPRLRLDVASLLRLQMEGQNVYCCGPAGLIEAVNVATQAWSTGTVHFERFKSDPNSTIDRALNSSFEIEIASTGQILIVPREKSILRVLSENGISHAYSCEEGICGTCAAGLLSGRADHRDSVLTQQERSAHNVLILCCSRAVSKRLRLDL
ncbi:PDR/VanB family oxidoreductase [Mesorhizobium sp. M0115]|uniref:PDR/VanB family oxidoreductase n=1 Tax=Mesorhizobium sp. M0115 TaxID=2956883 RepID=UPI0033371CB6